MIIAIPFELDPSPIIRRAPARVDSRNTKSRKPKIDLMQRCRGTFDPSRTPREVNCTIVRCRRCRMRTVARGERGWPDNVYFVVFAYLAAFLPLAVVYTLDFITEKWKSINETRRDGLIHFFVSLPPLGYLIAYAHVQRMAQDYKEMMTAITAVLLCIFHVSRTVWGLLQLRSFRRWNIRALRCIVSLGYEVPIYGYPDDDKTNWIHEAMKVLRQFRPSPTRERNQPWDSNFVSLRPSQRNSGCLQSIYASVRRWLQSFRATAHPGENRTKSFSSRSSSSALGQSGQEYSQGTVIASRSWNNSVLPRRSSSFSTPNQVRRGCLQNATSGLRRQNFSRWLGSISNSSSPSSNRSDSLGSSSTDLSLRQTCSRFFPMSLPRIRFVRKTMLEQKAHLSEREIEDTVDHHMVVNSTLIDNEFIHAELPCHLDFRSFLADFKSSLRMRRSASFAGYLTCRKAEECTIRWLVAFFFPSRIQVAA